MNIGDGAVRLSNKIFQQWRQFQVFETDVERFCMTLAARTGLTCIVDKGILDVAHRAWVSEHDEWINSHKMPHGTVELSHYKQAGILLWSLSTHPFVAFKQNGINDVWKEFYGKLAFADDRTIRKVTDGQHHFAAWVLCHNVVAWFEEVRTDRRTEFTARITDDFEVDIVSLLISGLHTSDALYLIMKALFFRE